MKIVEKYLRNNLVTLIVGLDIFYIVLFFLMYLLGADTTLNLNSVIDLSSNNPALLLMLLHPILFLLVLYLSSREGNKYNFRLTTELNHQNEKVEQVNQFIDQLRQGQTTIYFKSEFQQDKLVRSLLNLRDELEKTRKEDEHRKIEEQQRHWVNEGLAKFGAILRENVDDLMVLASEVTSNLTKYLNTQQAGFFVINEEGEDKVLEMIALFAFDRKKFPDKKFKWGEGLIGACAIEQKTIFLKETSDNFVDITSGLGKANPRSVLIVPIKDNSENVYGVLELASFKIFEDYEVLFIEQIANSIGLTIATIRTSLRTQELLRESQKQAEMLAQQDETMRNNIEEIENSREESEKRANTFEIYDKAVSKAIIRLNLDHKGNILSANEVFLKTFSYDNEQQIKGQNFTNLLTFEDKVWFQESIISLIQNAKQFDYELQMLNSNNKFLWIIGSFIPVIEENGKVLTVMFFATERSKDKKRFLEQENVVNTFSKLSINIEFDTKGIITSANKNFYELLGYDNSVINNLKVYDLLANEKDREQFSTIWANILKGKNYEAKQIFTTKENNKIQFTVIYSPIVLLDSIVEKVSLIALNISEIEIINTEKTALQNKLNRIELENKSLLENSQKQIEKAKEEIKKSYIEIEQKSIVLEQLFEKIDYAVVIILNDNIVFFNTMSEKFWGFKRNIVVGKKLRYLFPQNEKFNSDSSYLGNFVDFNEESEKQCFILDKEMNPKSVFASRKVFELGNDKYLAIFLKNIE